MRWRSAPASTSSAARRRDLGVVFVYWKRPVSVTSAMYNASAMSGVSWTSSSRNTSRSSSPVDEASASPGSLRTSPSSGMKPYSAGSGVSPARNISEPLPSCRSARSIASIEPSASPSGFSCVVTRKRSPPRIASAAFSSSVSIVVVWGELIDQLGHANASLDRRIVLEGQLGSPLHPQLAREPRLQRSMCSLQPLERLGALLLRAEDADEDLRVPQVGRRLHACDRDEPDARVLQLGHR